MALINCPECNKEVSDRAPTCPGCGTPIATDKESAGSGVQQLTTTQGTSKSLKLQSVLAMILLCAGIFMIYGQMQVGVTPGVFGILLAATGLLWAVITRIRIWWHHS